MPTILGEVEVDRSERRKCFWHSVTPARDVNTLAQSKLSTELLMALLLVSVVHILSIAVFGQANPGESGTYQTSAAAGPATSLVQLPFHRNDDANHHLVGQEFGQMPEARGRTLPLFSVLPMGLNQRMREGVLSETAEDPRERDWTSPSQCGSRAAMRTLDLFPQSPMELDQYREVISRNREADARLSDSSKRTSTHRPSAGRDTALHPRWLIEPSQGGDIGLQDSERTSAAVVEDARMRKRRQGQSVPGSSHIRTESERPLKALDSRCETSTPKKRCRKKFPGSQFPHYCSECNVSFKAICIGFLPLLA
jgi:hypothetical protein